MKKNIDINDVRAKYGGKRISFDGRDVKLDGRSTVTDGAWKSSARSVGSEPPTAQKIDFKAAHVTEVGNKKTKGVSRG